MLAKFISILFVFGAIGQAKSYSGRILNGENAVNIVPYHAQLGIRVGNEPERAGSGIIVSRRLVLTAGTNIHGFDTFRAGYGSIVRDQLRWANGIWGETVAGYNPDTYENNIGFIVFPSNAFDNEWVVPISIPPTPTSNLPYENEQGRIVGFGWTANNSNQLSDILQVAFNRVVSHTECTNLYGADPETSFCAVDNLSLTKICNGDQGTAFVTNVNGVEHLTGIASYVDVLDYQCVPGVPSLFVRTLAYRTVINDWVAVFN